MIYFDWGPPKIPLPPASAFIGEFLFPPSLLLRSFPNRPARGLPQLGQSRPRRLAIATPLRLINLP